MLSAGDRVDGADLFGVYFHFHPNSGKNPHSCFEVGSPCRAVAKVLDRNIAVCEFEFNWFYYAYFRLILLYSLAIG